MLSYEQKNRNGGLKIMALEFGAKKTRQRNSNENNMIKNAFLNCVVVSAGIEKGTTKSDIHDELVRQLKTPVKESIDSKTYAALMQAFCGGSNGERSNENIAEM